MGSDNLVVAAAWASLLSVKFKSWLAQWSAARCHNSCTVHWLRSGTDSR